MACLTIAKPPAAWQASSSPSLAASALSKISNRVEEDVEAVAAMSEGPLFIEALEPRDDEAMLPVSGVIAISLAEVGWEKEWAAAIEWRGPEGLAAEGCDVCL